MTAMKNRPFRVVIDFDSCPASQVLPVLLNEMGCEVIALNAYVEEGRGVKTARDKTQSLQQLSKIVTALEAKAGFQLDQTTEAITLVDETGRTRTPVELLSLIISLMVRSGEKGVFVVPVSAPSVVERLSHEKGCAVHRAKSTERAMIEASLSSNVILAGSMDGRFAFPRFQNAFDGMFAIAKTIELVASASLPVSGCIDSIPFHVFLQAKVPCVWEMKGSVMRRMSEDSVDKETTFIDGIKVNFGNDWALVLPDQYQPFIHIMSESKEENTARQLLEAYREKVEQWKKESA
jgi:mannose-1-phosphate guanylyltransferase/phosphomannomutase